MILGIDIGGTKIALAVGDEQGEILARTRRSTEASGNPRDDIERLVTDARALVSQAGGRSDAISAVGVSAPGPLDPARRMLLHPPNLPGWSEVPLADWLADALGSPIRLENDANAAALAEWRFGAGQGLRDVVYLTMSTGVGGGLILDGRLYTGEAGTAGELGHVPIEWGGELCGCGLRGCLEAYVGGLNWARHLQSATPEESRVLALAGAREGITAVELVEAAREGDAFACAEMERWNDYVARGIVALGFALAPQAVILGTIAVAAGESLCLEPIRRRVAEHIWPHQAPEMRILPAALGEDLPYRAGLCVALEALSSAAR